MKTPLRHKLGVLFLLLAVGFLLSNKVLACVMSASMDPMDMTQAMSCCADQCRQETSPEEARKACDQSRIGWLKEGSAGAVLIDSPSLHEPISPGSDAAASFAQWHPMTPSPWPRVHGPPQPIRSAERRILIQSFLI